MSDILIFVLPRRFLFLFLFVLSFGPTDSPLLFIFFFLLTFAVLSFIVHANRVWCPSNTVASSTVGNLRQPTRLLAIVITNPLGDNVLVSQLAIRSRGLYTDQRNQSSTTDTVLAHRRRDLVVQLFKQRPRPGHLLLRRPVLGFEPDEVRLCAEAQAEGVEEFVAL